MSCATAARSTWALHIIWAEDPPQNQGGFAMAGTWNRRGLGLALLASLIGLGLVAKTLVGAAQSSREAEGARLLKGALDLHFHMDPNTPDRIRGAGIAEV